MRGWVRGVVWLGDRGKAEGGVDISVRSAIYEMSERQGLGNGHLQDTGAVAWLHHIGVSRDQLRGVGGVRGLLSVHCVGLWEGGLVSEGNRFRPK